MKLARMFRSTKSDTFGWLGIPIHLSPAQVGKINSAVLSEFITHIETNELAATRIFPWVAILLTI